MLSLAGGIMNRQRYRQAIVTAALALSAVSAGVDNALAARSPPSLGATNDSIETFTYGPCNGPSLYQAVDGTSASYASCYHNWGLTFANSVVIFSRTAAERNGALGNPMPAGTPDATNIAQAGLKRLLLAAGVATVTIGETTGSVPGQGNTVGAVIFLDNSGDALWDHGKSVNVTNAVSNTTSAFTTSGYVALRQYLRAGGGFVAIHNAVGMERNWNYYVGLLGNASTYDSAAIQPGTVQIEASDSSTAGVGAPGTQFALGAAGVGGDTFYNLVPFPNNVKYLATVLEGSLTTKKSVHPGHGIFHPVAWCQYYDGGRSWVTTLGQDPRLWADLSLAINQPGGANYFPGAAQFQSLVVNGVLSAMGKVPFCT
jgi:type 1 glutamine amidotransferase